MFEPSPSRGKVAGRRPDGWGWSRRAAQLYESKM